MSNVKAEYEKRFDVLTKLAGGLERQLHDYFKGQKRIDRISARPKSIDSFVKKAAAEVEGKAKYNDPIHQIQDQVGARIVTFYRSDVDPVVEIIKKYYRPIETK